MGQKTHPLGFRLGITQEHRSTWYANFNQYANLLEEDDQIRTYLDKLARAASISNIQINRNGLGDQIQLNIETGRPGALVGENGSGIQDLLKNIKNYNEDKYIEMAESELGPLVLHDWEFEPVPDKPEYSRIIDRDTEEEKIHNRKVFDRAHEIEEQEWNELFQILKGQDYKEYRKLYAEQTEEEKRKRELWDEWFDGSGIKGWWD